MTTFPTPAMREAQARQAREAALPQRDRQHIAAAREDIMDATERGHPQSDLLLSIVYLDATERLHRALILAAGDEAFSWLDEERDRRWLAACDARQEAANDER